MWEVDHRLLASGLMICLCHWQDNDFLRNRVHRHEPPVTADPVRLLAENEDVVVVDKPSSIPVHPCGRFRHNSVIFILGKEHQLKELHPLHRLDRLTSGVLMFAKTAAVSERIHEQVRDRQVSWAFVFCIHFLDSWILCIKSMSLSSVEVAVHVIWPIFSSSGRSTLKMPKTGYYLLCFKRSFEMAYILPFLVACPF